MKIPCLHNTKVLKVYQMEQLEHKEVVVEKKSLTCSFSIEEKPKSHFLQGEAICSFSARKRRSYFNVFRQFESCMVLSYFWKLITWVFMESCEEYFFFIWFFLKMLGNGQSEKSKFRCAEAIFALKIQKPTGRYIHGFKVFLNFDHMSHSEIIQRTFDVQKG